MTDFNSDLYYLFQSKDLEDKVKRLNNVKDRQKKAGTFLNASTYVERNEKSGFREVETVDGSKSFAVYNSNSRLQVGQRLPNSQPYISGSQIGFIDKKPAS